MELLKRNNEFILKCNYEDRMIPKMNGFKWNPTDRYWYTTDVITATKLSKYANEQTLLLLTNNIEDRKQAIKESSLDACEVDIDIPIKAGQSYLPYQKAGIVYALKRNNVCIFDDQGVGKTLEAIGIINADITIKKILIVCPATLKINWKNELNKFLVYENMSIGFVDKEFPNTNIVIMNYDILKKCKEQIDNVEWDLLISDEAHFLKNSKTARCISLLGGMEKQENGKKKKVYPIKARKKVFMTGTPILNRPVELWPILKAVDPHGLGSNWFHYVQRYCAGERTKWGWDVKGSSNLEELNDLLRGSVMIRRTKAQVLKELPPKRRTVVVIPSTPQVDKIIHAEKSFYDINKDKINAKVELAKSQGKDEYEAVVSELSEGTLSEFSQLSKLRHDTAVAKVPLIMEHIINAAESEPLVIFAHHTDVIHAIMKELKANNIKCASIIGGDKIEHRQQVVDDFQSGKLTVLVLSILAAGVGITLTASSHVINVEIDYRAGVMTQAEDRCHRYGCKNSVLVEYLVLDGSLDIYMSNMIIEKQKIMDKALDNKTDGITTDINKLQAQAVMPEMELFSSVNVAKENKIFDEAPF